MGLRPGRCYRSNHGASYTRIAVTVPDRNYIGTSPQVKIRQFNMGNPEKNFKYVLDLMADESLQMRDNAIESARITINRFLLRKIGKDAYFMKIRIFPFQILRENKIAQGAGADRVSSGMSHAFGKPIGRAVRVRPGKVLFSLLVDEENLPIAEEALRRAHARMPVKIKVKIGTNTESIGTKPRKTKVEEEAVKPEAVVAEGEAAAGAEAGKTADAPAGKAGAKAPAAGKDAGKADAKTADKKDAKKK